MSRRTMLAVAAALVTTGAGTTLATAETVHSAFTAAAGADAHLAAAEVFAPRSIAVPVVEGQAREGATLTATDGVWARAPERHERAWLRCDDDGARCEAIEDGSAAVRTVTGADVGHTLVLEVRAVNAGGAALARSAPTARVTASDLVPAAVSPPRVTGAAVVGQTLVAAPGAWEPAPTSTELRWLRCTPACVPSGTGTRRLLTGEDAGATLRLEVTASNGAGAASASSEGTAPVARATYTHVVCADPPTQQGVLPDGVIPNGVTILATTPEMGGSAAASRCASGGGILLSTFRPFTLAVGGRGATLQYRALNGLTFGGATIARTASVGGRFEAATLRFAAPSQWDERCRSVLGCRSLGAPAAPFAAASTLTLAKDTDINGFDLKLTCEAVAGSPCLATGAETVRLHGARVTVTDQSTPQVTTAAGDLASAPVIGSDASLRVGATDAQTGPYRVLVLVGDTQVEARALWPATGGCADALPANGDPYEFAHQRPCPASVTRDMTFATAAWPRGRHRLRVLVEDAGRNTAVAVDREVLLP